MMLFTGLAMMTTMTIVYLRFKHLICYCTTHLDVDVVGHLTVCDEGEKQETDVYQQASRQVKLVERRINMEKIHAKLGVR